MCLGGKWWWLVEVYVNNDLEEKKLETLREWMESTEEGVRVLIGGDFNARTGEVGGGVENKEGEWRTRRSRDGMINGEGRKLCGFLDKLGWVILTGNMKENEKGERTFTGGKRGSVIDYLVENSKTREGIRKLRIGERVDSDHQPLTVWLGRARSAKKSGEKRRRRGEKGVWTEEGKKRFEKCFERRG